MPCLTLSFHLYLGLACDLLVRGFHLNIFLTVLVSGILCTWPNQLSLWALIWLNIFLCFISLSNSSLVLILHIWFHDLVILYVYIKLRCIVKHSDTETFKQFCSETRGCSLGAGGAQVVSSEWGGKTNILNKKINFQHSATFNLSCWAEYKVVQ